VPIGTVSNPIDIGYAVPWYDKLYPDTMLGSVVEGEIRDKIAFLRIIVLGLIDYF